jgi:hypothetical protein
MVPANIESLAEVCGRCGSTSLGDQLLDALVFAEKEILSSTLTEKKCAECSWESFEGSELFLLRKASFSSRVLGNFEMFFHWDLLNKTLEELVEGYYFNSKWTRQMRSYRVFWDHASVEALTSVYPHFRAACMDFVDLMQLDYKSRLACHCVDPHRHLVIDGITISSPLNKMHLVGPWLPKASDGPLMQHHGSLHRDRMVVQNAELRKFLLQFSSAEGMHVAAFEDMCAGCEKAGWARLGGLLRELRVDVAGRARISPAWARTLVRELGSNSPACAIVPVLGEPLLQQWLELSYALLDGNAANHQDLLSQWTPFDSQVQREMPKLWLPLREVQRSICMFPGAPLNGIFLDVFARLLQVRSALSYYHF